jgi:DNA-binding MarR family transcriptional regulator
MTEVEELIKAYERKASIKELAARFGVHRLTVTALLLRHGVELRRAGLTPDEVSAAALLYRHGWSLARLGSRFGVDPSTVWRALRAEGMGMRLHRR